MGVACCLAGRHVAAIHLLSPSPEPGEFAVTEIGDIASQPGQRDTIGALPRDKQFHSAPLAKAWLMGKGGS